MPDNPDLVIRNAAAKAPYRRCSSGNPKSRQPVSSPKVLTITITATGTTPVADSPLYRPKLSEPPPTEYPTPRS
ncbi:MAG TPA: hypothetical protein VIC05_06010 [Solirubrobacteraceae bacterium]